MSEGKLELGGKSPPVAKSPFERFLEDWIARAPPELAAAVRHAAVPHSFDVALLNALRGVGLDAGAPIARLERDGLLVTRGPDRYAIHPMLRALCLRTWWTEEPEAYRQLSARATEFYLAQEPVGEAEQLEIVYHQLGAGDEGGLEALSQAFEGAWAARRLGFAERLLQYADEQVPVLGTGTRAWLRYFHARLDLAQGRYRDSKEALEPLLSPGVDAGLRAAALMSLAGVFTATRRWKEARERYASAHDVFLELGDRFRAARALEARGITYLHLASGLGGLYETASAVQPPLVIWFRRFEYAPFLLYRWLSRRFSFVPNLYFGADYQDWIIYRLLFSAIGNLQQAGRELAAVPKEAGLPVEEVQAGIQIHLADLYHRVGRWTKAQRRFRQLAGSVPVRTDDYRRATLQLARGRAALTRTRLVEAREHLQDARQVFAHYSDHRALAEAARLLGDTEVASDHLPEAMPLYDESVDASLAVDDLLASTHVWSTLRRLRQRPDLPAPVGSQLEALEQKLDRRAYIMRFRGGVLEHFRKISGRWACVFLVVIELLMTIIYIQRFRVIAAISRILPSQLALLGDLAAGVVFLLLILLPAVWLYAFFYVLTGWRFVRSLDLGDIAQFETEFVLTVPQGMATRLEGEQLSESPWEAVGAYVSANVAIWREPIALLSRFFVLSEAPALIVDGVARHYASLQQDIRGRLAQARNSAVQHATDFSVFGSRWTLVALLLVLGMTAESLFDWLAAECREPGIVPVLHRDQNYACAITDEGRLYVVDLWDIEDWGRDEELPPEGVLHLGDQLSDVAVAGGYAYVTASEAGLRVVEVDVSAHEVSLSLVGSVGTPGQASGVAVGERHAYIADGTEGLRVVDITQADVPVEVGFCDTPGEAEDVAVTGDYAYVADGSGGLRVVDIADPTDPVEVGFHDTGGRASAVAVWRHFAYVALEDAGLEMFDLKDPSAPAPVGLAAAGAKAYDVTVARRYAFVAAGPQGFWILHLADPADKSLADTSGMLKQASGVAVAFDYAYVADGSGGLWVLDVLNPCYGGFNPVRYPRDLGSVAKVAVPAPIPLPIASTTFGLVFWALLFFPIIGLARFLRTRSAQRRILGARLVGGRDWPLWLGLVLFVVLAGFNALTLLR